MNWTRHVDIYCERLDPGFWAEPVNAFTNASFVLAALVMVQRVRDKNMHMAWVLIGLLALIGIGSFLFHTVAEPWAGALDVAPIVMFIVTYIFVASRDFLNLSPWTSGLVAVVFLPIAALLIPVFRMIPLYGDSAGYLLVPILIALYAWLLRDTPALSRGLAMGAGLLMVSLTFRCLDMPICSTLPLGTHFLWHILNAILLAWMIEVYRCHRLAQQTLRR